MFMVDITNLNHSEIGVSYLHQLSVHELGHHLVVTFWATTKHQG